MTAGGVRARPKQVTLRFPPAEHRRLRQVCTQYGISIGAFFEACAMVYLGEIYGSEQFARLCAIAQQVEASGYFAEDPERPRRQIVFRMDAELAERYRTACRGLGISQNVGFGMAIMPWRGVMPDDLIELAEGNRDHLLCLARAIDVTRRGGNLMP